MKFLVVNDNDGNDSFEVNAKNSTHAAHLALKELGWWVAKNENEYKPKNKVIKKKKSQ
jgi:hypothetical protein